MMSFICSCNLQTFFSSAFALSLLICSAVPLSLLLVLRLRSLFYLFCVWLLTRQSVVFTEFRFEERSRHPEVIDVGTPPGLPCTSRATHRL
jgi:hypothetical protein